MKNIINKIRQVYSVSDEALQALQADMQVRYYPKNTYIVHSGVTDRLVYFIEEGVARSVFHHNGQDTTTWFSQEGDITFGMDSLYYKQPSVESIEALSDCKIYVIHIVLVYVAEHLRDVILFVFLFLEIIYNCLCAAIQLRKQFVYGFCDAFLCIPSLHSVFKNIVHSVLFK